MLLAFVVLGLVSSVNTWLSMNRLKLNAAKTQLMWLGLSPLLDKIACQEVLVLGARVAVSESARDRLSVRLPSATPASTNSPFAVCTCHEDAGSGVHLMSPGLPQLTTVRYQRRTTSPLAVGAERCCAPGLRRSLARPHHTGAAAAALAASPTTDRVQGRRTRPPVTCWSDPCVPR